MSAELTVLISLARNDGADTEAIAAIEDESFAEPGVDLAAELARPWARVWVARSAAADPPEAFLLAWSVADELHILSVATAPEARRKGMARALMGHALAFAREHAARLVLLEVRRSNHPAIRLYRGFGFSAMGVRPRYYADNSEDAIEMILVLDPATGEIQPRRDEVRIEEA